jgi:imidazole glycerol-phosphate synthase subunit HisF
VRYVIIGTKAVKNPHFVATTPVHAFPATSSSGSTRRTARWRSTAGPSSGHDVSIWRASSRSTASSHRLHRHRPRRHDERRQRRGHASSWREAAAIPVIASGGVTSLDDIRAVRGRRAGIIGAITGRALYEGTLDLAAAQAQACSDGRSSNSKARRAWAWPNASSPASTSTGRVVKGVNFVDIRDAGDPVEIARRYDEQGADEITFLDITASSDERETMVHVVERMASEVFIPLTVGGGIREVEDVPPPAERRRRQGLDQHRRGAEPEFVREAAGASAASASSWRSTPSGQRAGEPALGDLHPRRPQATGLDAVEWARRMAEYGAGEILLTSMDRDGTRDGFDLALTRAVSDAVSARDRLGRRRQSRAPGGRRRRGPCRRGAGREHLPFRFYVFSEL